MARDSGNQAGSRGLSRRLRHHGANDGRRPRDGEDERESRRRQIPNQRHRTGPRRENDRMGAEDRRLPRRHHRAGDSPRHGVLIAIPPAWLWAELSPLPSSILHSASPFFVALLLLTVNKIVRQFDASPVLDGVTFEV